MDVSEQQLLMKRDSLGLDFEIRDDKIIFPTLPTIQKKILNLEKLKASYLTMKSAKSVVKA